MSDVDFKAVLAESGIPTTEEALLARWRQIATDENVVFNNTSAYSPFWRLVSALVTKPVLWLLSLLWGEILPALFMKTAMQMDTPLWVDLFAYQLGLTRKPATKARGVITFTRTNASEPLTVAAGTVIQTASILGRVYRLRTVAAATFITGQTSIGIVAEAEESGAAYNLANGFYALVSTPLAGIASVSNAADWLLIPGADEETNVELGERCRNQFAAVNQWHIDAAYTSLVTQWAGVAVADVYIEHDAPRGPGTANIYILFDFGLPVTEYLTAMQQHIMADGNHGFGDDVKILPLPMFPLDVNASLVISPTLTADQRTALVTEIGNFIRVALRSLPPTNYSPTRIEPFKRFAWSRLIRELHNQFVGLESIDFAADTDLQPQMAIPSLRNLNLVVMA